MFGSFSGTNVFSISTTSAYVGFAALIFVLLPKLPMYPPSLLDYFCAGAELWSNALSWRKVSEPGVTARAAVRGAPRADAVTVLGAGGKALISSDHKKSVFF